MHPKSYADVFKRMIVLASLIGFAVGLASLSNVAEARQSGTSSKQAVAPQYAWLRIVKSATPADDTVFSFTSAGLGNFNLQDPSNPNITFPTVTAGTYNITEDAPGWAATITCDSGVWGANGSTLTITLASGDHVTCTFTNTVAPTNTPTDVPPTNTPTDTPTDVPPTNTPTDTPTDVPPTDTPTDTPTDVPPTPTATDTPTDLLAATADCQGPDLVVTIASGEGPFTISAGAGINMPVSAAGLGSTVISGPEKWDDVTVTETNGDFEAVNLGQFKCYPVGRPVQVAPAHRSILTDPYPTFSVMPFPDASNYRVWVFDDPDLALRTVDIRENSGGALSMQLSQPLDPGRYFWRARARVNRIWSRWSTRWMLRIE